MELKQKELDLFYNKIRNIRQVDKLEIEVLKVFKNAINFEVVPRVISLNIESLVFKDEVTLCAIPLKTPQGLMKQIREEGKKTLGQKILEKLNVHLIPYRSRKYIFNIISNENKLEQYRKMYRKEYMLSQIYTVYKDIKEFDKFKDLILESIECFSAGRYATSITLMISIIEGISREYCDNNKINYHHNGSKSVFKSLIKSRINFYIENMLLYDFSSKRNYLIPSEFKFYGHKKTVNHLLLYNNEMLE